MEFGINFSAICADLERRFRNSNQFFPNWELQDDMGLMDSKIDPDKSRDLDLVNSHLAR